MPVSKPELAFAHTAETVCGSTGIISLPNFLITSLIGLILLKRCTQSGWTQTKGNVKQVTHPLIFC